MMHLPKKAADGGIKSFQSVLGEGGFSPYDREEAATASEPKLPCIDLVFFYQKGPKGPYSANFFEKFIKPSSEKEVLITFDLCNVGKYCTKLLKSEVSEAEIGKIRVFSEYINKLTSTNIPSAEIALEAVTFYRNSGELSESASAAARPLSSSNPTKPQAERVRKSSIELERPHTV